MIAAHVAGMPIEELLPTLAGPVTGLVAARAWLTLSLRRRGERGG